MPWKCPVCSRTFRNTNQAHSCALRDADEHFAGSLPSVLLTWEKLMKRVVAFGDVRISSVRNAILVSAGSTFLAVKPRKSWLDIEFLLGEKTETFPVYKIVRANKSRLAHFARLEVPADVDRQLIGWLKKAYSLAIAKAPRNSGCR